VPSPFQRFNHFVASNFVEAVLMILLAQGATAAASDVSVMSGIPDIGT